MAFGKSDKTKADARQARETARAEKGAANAARAFAKSPTGQARDAYVAGARFFEIELPHSAVTERPSIAPGLLWGVQTSTPQMKTYAGAPDVLGQIEEQGWHLEHASWVYVETGQSSRDKAFSSGQQVVVKGQVRGIFLFRRVDPAPVAGQPVGGQQYQW